MMQEKNVTNRMGNAMTAVRTDMLRVCSVGAIPAIRMGIPRIRTRMIKMKTRGIGNRSMYKSAPVSKARNAMIRILSIEVLSPLVIRVKMAAARTR
jgi:hypothetical protein